MQIKVQHPKPAVIFLYDYVPSILSEKIQEFLINENYKRRQKGQEEITPGEYEEFEDEDYANLPADEQFVLQRMNRVRVLGMIKKIETENHVVISDVSEIEEFIAKISKEDFEILTAKSIIKVEESNEIIEKKTSQTPKE